MIKLWCFIMHIYYDNKTVVFCYVDLVFCNFEPFQKLHSVLRHPVVQTHSRYVLLGKYKFCDKLFDY